jgi:hypothetical protein
MKKRVLLAAFLFAAMMANQAVACDMGAIETWVAAACQRNGCETKSTTKIRLRAVTAAIVPRFIPLCDLN